MANVFSGIRPFVDGNRLKVLVWTYSPILVMKCGGKDRSRMFREIEARCKSTNCCEYD